MRLLFSKGKIFKTYIIPRKKEGLGLIFVEEEDMLEILCSYMLTLQNNNQATLSKDGHASYRLHNIKFHIHVPELICTYTHFCGCLYNIN